MLNQRERHHVLKFLRRFCIVGVLPLKVDINSWEIHPYAQTSWKKSLCTVSFAIYCVHVVFQSLSLLHVVMFLRSTPLYQVILHMIMVSAYAGSSFWYYLLYIKYPGTNAAVVRMTLNGSVDGRRFI